MLIPDTSVAVKWYLSEVGSGMLVRMRQGKIGMGHVAHAAADLPIRVALSPLTESLIGPALEMGAEMAHYPQDCLYLAQAVAEGRRLVTADEKFFRKAEKSRWRDYVVRLPDALNRIG